MLVSTTYTQSTDPQGDERFTNAVDVHDAVLLFKLQITTPQDLLNKMLCMVCLCAVVWCLFGLLVFLLVLTTPSAKPTQIEGVN